MNKYFKYLQYLIKHKYYVGVECFKRGLYWQGLAHDLSKFSPDEFIPYANYFYGNGDNLLKFRDKTGYYKPYDTGDKKFDFAWFLHQKRNKHHWQFWVLPTDDATLKVLEIPLRYKTEMVCDWIGASKAQGFFSPWETPMLETQKWYKANKDKMQFAPETRKWIERQVFRG